MKNEPKIAFLICLIALLFLTSPIVLPRVVEASLPLLYTPPTQVTLEMYVLDRDGSVAFGRPRCQAGDKLYGCTYFVEGADPSTISPYPFGSDNTPTIGIESHPVSNVQQGYLHNVVPQELDPGHAFSSVKAQAIAARTYAYYQINTLGSMNNSSERQVYIPYRYDALSAADKTDINQAVAGNPYMSIPNTNNDPIEAFFTADNDAWTANGSTSYLKNVFDPISIQEGTDIGHQLGGMGQKAAGRWGAGRTAEYPGQGSPWSVRWDAAEQILAHYFTGITFVNSDPNLSNDYRFNILEIAGLPENISLEPGETIQGLDVTVQNSGVFYWPVVPIAVNQSCPSSGHPTRLSYHLYKADNSELACEANQGVNSACFAIERFGLCQYDLGQADSDKVLSGHHTDVPNMFIRIPSQVPPGTYNLRFDLEIVNTEWASGLPNANHWPAQDIQITVEDPNGGGGGGGSQGSVKINHPPAVFDTADWQQNGQQFGFSWTPTNGANLFDLEYRSREFFTVNWSDWINTYGSLSTHNIPNTSFMTPVDCTQDRHQFEFRVRGQNGIDGQEGPWKPSYSNLKVYPFLSVNNVSSAYVVFFELASPDTTYSGNLNVTNAGGGTLQWQASENSNLIDLSPTSGTDDGTIVVTISKPTGGLGTYPAGNITVDITSANPAPCNNQQEIDVTIYVVEQIEKMYFPIILKQATP